MSGLCNQEFQVRIPVKKQTTEQYRSWALRNPEKVQAKRERRYARERVRREALMEVFIAHALSVGCKRIAKYPAYFVSSGGSIFSTHGRRFIKVSPGVKPGGYEFVGLVVNGKTKYEMVHRLVATAFIPNPHSFPEVNHLDSNRRNNCMANLEWCTHQQNVQHMLDAKKRMVRTITALHKRGLLKS